MTLLPMLANDIISTGELDRMLASSEHCVQEKADGKRMFLGRDAQNQLICTNKRGEPAQLPSGIKPVRMPAESLLDIEYLAGGRFCFLDLLAWAGESYAQRSMIDRWKMLMLVAARYPANERAFTVPTAFRQEDKTVLIQRLRDERAEGLIIKLCSAPYTSGAGGAIWRNKWKKRMDAVVLRVPSSQKRAFEIFAFENGKTVPIGRVTAHTFWDKLQDGESSVAEIEYLYASADLRLVQAQMVRLRTDKLPTECGVDQMVISKKFRVAA